ncbi:MAG TPA: type IX secretion system membrane protein PorP/SprF [Bacteroidetes bacterium]|nr:type IX secretion system membrane protein PorP/SprF [Bacteroidota bacterium]
MIKLIKIFLLFFPGFVALNAQQDALYTQFMYNKLGINPAYAGNDDALCFTGIVRDQWAGFAGTPKTQALSVNFARWGKVGFGLNFSRSTIGVSEKMTFEGIYAYKVPIGEGLLSLGMSFSGRSYKEDFADPTLRIINPFIDDQAIDQGIYQTKVFNVGFGAYYSNNRFYLGFSSPRLIRSDIDMKVGLKKSYEVRHAYIMTGGAIDIRRNLVMMPQMLIRWAENSPYNVDLNLGLLFYDRFYTAMTARTGGASDDWFESIDFIMGFHLNRNLFMAAAYDVTVSPLRNYENGSLEVLLQYCFGNKQKPIDIINPRFF